jgi:hypothetical protein
MFLPEFLSQFGFKVNGRQTAQNAKGHWVFFPALSWIYFGRDEKDEIKKSHENTQIYVPR